MHKNTGLFLYEVDLNKSFHVQRKKYMEIGYFKSDAIDKKSLAAIASLCEAIGNLEKNGFKYWSNEDVTFQTFKDKLIDVFGAIIAIGDEMNITRDKKFEIVKTSGEPIGLVMKIIESVTEVCKQRKLGLHAHPKYFTAINDFFTLCSIYHIEPSYIIENFCKERDDERNISSK